VITEAVILAAGKGTRLRTSDDDLPKPLHRVGGVALIERTIRTLGEAGVRRVIVVTGFMADTVEATLASLAVDVTVEPIRNPDFEQANGISVLVGGALATGPFVLSMADHLYTTAIARLVGTQDMTAADLYLATDPRIHDVLDIDDATKVATDAGRIVEIGKTIATYDRIDCGVFSVTSGLLAALRDERVARGDCSLSDGVRRLAHEGRARACDIGDSFWQDVDTPADRALAEQRLKGG